MELLFSLPPGAFHWALGLLRPRLGLLSQRCPLHFCPGTPIPGWQSLIPGPWELPGVAFRGLSQKRISIQGFRNPSSPPRKDSVCGKGKVLAIAVALSSLTPQIQTLINYSCGASLGHSPSFWAWPAADKPFIWRNVKMATQAQNVKILSFGCFLGLASR